MSSRVGTSTFISSSADGHHSYDYSPHNFSAQRASQVHFDALSLREKASYLMRFTSLGFWMDIVQVLFSTVSIIAFVWSTYQTDVSGFSMLEYIFSFSFVADYLFRWFASENRLRYIFRPTSLVDLLSMLPVVTLFLSNHADLPSLYFLKVVRFLRILRILRAIRVVTYGKNFFSEDSVQRQVFVMSFMLFTLVFCTAGLIQVIEASFGDQVLQFHDAFYFIIITIATVGYGDISPKSAFGRMVMVVFVAVSVALVPVQTARLIDSIRLNKAAYGGRYVPAANQKHVVVTGEMDYSSLKNFLNEFFHIAHGNHKITVVVLLNQAPSARMKVLLKSKKFDERVCYVEGSALSSGDMRRACVSTADACFILTDKQSETPQTTDAETILRTLSVKNANPRLHTFVQVLLPQNKPHVVSAGAETVVCVNQLRMSLLAESALCRGFATLVSNLFYDLGSVTSFSSWEAEYCRGLCQSIHTTLFAPTLCGLSFCEASVVVYQAFGCVLFGVQRVDKETSIKYTMLNPGRHFFIEPEDVGFVFAPDLTSALQISAKRLTHLEIMDFLTINKQTGSFSPVPSPAHRGPISSLSSQNSKSAPNLVSLDPTLADDSVHIEIEAPIVTPQHASTPTSTPPNKRKGRSLGDVRSHSLPAVPTQLSVRSKRALSGLRLSVPNMDPLDVGTMSSWSSGTETEDSPEKQKGSRSKGPDTGRASESQLETADVSDDEAVLAMMEGMNTVYQRRRGSGDNIAITAAPFPSTDSLFGQDYASESSASALRLQRQRRQSRFKTAVGHILGSREDQQTQFPTPKSEPSKPRSNTLSVPRPHRLSVPLEPRHSLQIARMLQDVEQPRLKADPARRQTVAVSFGCAVPSNKTFGPHVTKDTAIGHRRPSLEVAQITLTPPTPHIRVEPLSGKTTPTRKSLDRPGTGGRRQGSGRAISGNSSSGDHSDSSDSSSESHRTVRTSKHSRDRKRHRGKKRESSGEDEPRLGEHDISAAVVSSSRASPTTSGTPRLSLDTLKRFSMDGPMRSSQSSVSDSIHRFLAIPDSTQRSVDAVHSMGVSFHPEIANPFVSQAVLAQSWSSESLPRQSNDRLVRHRRVPTSSVQNPTVEILTPPSGAALPSDQHDGTRHSRPSSVRNPFGRIFVEEIVGDPFDPTEPNKAGLEQNFFLRSRPRSQTQATVKQLPQGVRDHFVVCGNVNDLQHLLLPLRSRVLNHARPIVILHPHPLTPAQWSPISMFPEVYVMKGSPRNVEHLRRAGVRECKCVLVLSERTTPSKEEHMADFNSILTWVELQSKFPDVHVVMEFVYRSNFKFLKPAYMGKISLKNDFLVPNYAAGKIFSDNMMDALLCQTFYSPYCIDILQLLISASPKKISQSSHLYLMQVPTSCYGRTYGELFVLLALKRGMVCLGLYRVPHAQGSPYQLPYVFCCPSSNTVVFEGDQVYVLSGKEPKEND